MRWSHDGQASPAPPTDARDEALRRLASVSVGRLVFTIAGLPAIRPVNHLVDDGAVVVRSDLGSV
jgi:Pyridoxamine 5'-phosphate oxidase